MQPVKADDPIPRVGPGRGRMPARFLLGTVPVGASEARVVAVFRGSGVVIVAPGYATAIRVTKGWIAAPVGQRTIGTGICATLNDPVPVQ